MQILSRATKIIAEGEVQQLGSIRNLETSEAEYLEIISCKTARLFAAAAESAAILAGAEATTVNALQDYGLHLGMAFQLVDDQLDYGGNPEVLGKNTGDDLAQGKVTLPLIVAMRDGTDEQRCFVKDAITSGGSLATMIQTLRETGGLDYTLELATRHQQQALDCLHCVEASSYQSALDSLVKFVVARSH